MHPCVWSSTPNATRYEKLVNVPVRGIIGALSKKGRHLLVFSAVILRTL